MTNTLAPDGSTVVPDGVVFRLAKVSDNFPADSKKPLAIHFQFSTDEKRLAAKTGLWLQSVFDTRLTSPDDARKLATAPADRLAFALPVVGIHAIKLESDSHPLWIIRDVVAGDDRRGAAGHCGLFGIHRRLPDERKALRDKVCEIAYLL